jgi:hypothetical protein
MTKLKGADVKSIVEYAVTKRTELENALIARLIKIIVGAIHDNAEQGIIDFVIKDKRC